MFGIAWRTGPLPVEPARLVSDEQISALVDAALALSQRQRGRHAAVMSVEARERLVRLDRAVRAGGLVLAERAAAREGASAVEPRPAHTRALPP